MAPASHRGARVVMAVPGGAARAGEGPAALAVWAARRTMRASAVREASMQTLACLAGQCTAVLGSA